MSVQRTRSPPRVGAVSTWPTARSHQASWPDAVSATHGRGPSPGGAQRLALGSADGRHPADPSRPVQTPLPLFPHPDSEQKSFGDSIIDIVDEKNRKKWKL